MPKQRSIEEVEQWLTHQLDRAKSDNPEDWREARIWQLGQLRQFLNPEPTREDEAGYVVHERPTLEETSSALIGKLKEMADSWGALGVAHAAAQLVGHGYECVRVPQPVDRSADVAVLDAAIVEAAERLVGYRTKAPTPEFARLVDAVEAKRKALQPTPEEKYREAQKQAMLDLNLSDGDFSLDEYVADLILDALAEVPKP